MSEKPVASIDKPAETGSRSANYLREKGIQYLQKYCGDLWTDHNTHDPGITILESLCYAITDISYRTQFPLEDILAQDKDLLLKNLHTAREIFPNHPVTTNDYRKLLIDIEGVRNAWMLKSTKQEMPLFVDITQNRLSHYPMSIHPEENIEVNLRGLYEVWVDFESDDEGYNNTVIDKIWQKLHAHRNLGEDFFSIKPIEHVDVNLKTRLAISGDALAEEVAAMVILAFEEYINGTVQFYSLNDMLDKGKSAQEIFSGPLLENGFIDNDELAKAGLKTELYLSDIINLLMDIPGVESLPTKPQWVIDNNWKKEIQWKVSLDKEGSFHYKVDLTAATSVLDDIEISRNGIPIELDKERVIGKYRELKSENQRIRVKGLPEDIPVPMGEKQDLGAHFPLQETLPKIYHTGSEGISDNESTYNKASARQLKAYLLFFDQLLANYLQQLSGINHLFAYNDDQSNSGETYFSRTLLDVAHGKELFTKTDEAELLGKLKKLAENDALTRERRNMFMDHLLARFSMVFADYSLQVFRQLDTEKQVKGIAQKSRVLSHFPAISQNRSNAQNMMAETNTWWKLKHAGFRNRVYHLLDMDVPIFQDEYHTPGVFFIDKIKINAQNGKYAVQVLDFISGSTEPLAESIEYPSKEEALGFMEYMVAHSQQYEFLLSASGHRFEIKNADNDVAMTSKAFGTDSERDEAMEDVKAALNNLKRAKGFHLFENILLRPFTESDHHIDRRQEHEDPYYTYYDNGFYLITEGGEPIIFDEAPEDQEFSHHIVVVNDTYKIAFKKEDDKWGYELIKSGEEDVLYLKNTDAFVYSTYKELRTAIYELKLLAADRNNYYITNDGTEYYFELRNAKEEAVAKSRTYENENIEEDSEYENRVFPGYWAPSEDKKSDPRLLDIWEYLQQPLHLKSVSPQRLAEYKKVYGLFDHDMYSFRGMAVLPGWSKEYANAEKRALAEKVLRNEAPAHFYITAWWLSLQQMYVLEEAYHNWFVARQQALYGPQDKITADANRSRFLNELIDIWNQLRNKEYADFTDADYTDNYYKGEEIVI